MGKRPEENVRDRAFPVNEGPGTLINTFLRRKCSGYTYSSTKCTYVFIGEFLLPLTVFPQIPLIIALHSSSSSLGSLSLYRNSVQCFLFAARNLLNTIQMAFQSIFLLGAFSAAMEMEPRMQPKKGSALPYKNMAKGMKLEARFVFIN